MNVYAYTYVHTYTYIKILAILKKLNTERKKNTEKQLRISKITLSLLNMLIDRTFLDLFNLSKTYK